MTDPSRTPLGKRLLKREGSAISQWHELRTHMPWRVSDESWDEFLSTAARPMTWRLWEIAIEEAGKLR